MSDDKNQSGKGWDWSKLVSDALGTYAQIEVAKATGGIATAPHQQAAGLNSVPQYQNPQAKAGELGALPGNAGGGLPPWLWPLLIGGAVIGGAMLLRK